MQNKSYLKWKYARNYQIATNKCYVCGTELVYNIETVKIGNKTLENAKVLSCPNCSNKKE